ncbi:MAG TPA: beta-ketoacyl-ACP synthase III [Chitinophagales bacterium]|nr:beta-ketoacyl-ACP synthase III [Chitinophagales bacterium]
MSFKEVYINRAAHFFPNSPVANEEMESYLGLINGRSSKSRAIVLRNNGIKRRFYALEKGGKATHTNAQMVSLAVRELFKDNPEELKTVQLLTAGTSSPDQVMPSHGVMVHGWLPETGPIEVLTPAGNCCAGLQALKYAFLSIRSGDVQTAVSAGSERTSRLMCADSFKEEARNLADMENNPYLSFEKDFLRWMLSDGAGAFLVSDKKNEEGVSLRIEWMESASYAHMIDTCMYQGCDKLPDGTLQSYMEYTAEEITGKSIFAMKQDVKLLDKHIVELGYETLKGIIEKKALNMAELDWFLPHISSEFFRKKIAAKLEENGIGIPQEKWFSNLSQVGNVGAGSVYLMIDELLAKGKLQKGQKLLLMVPESARFAYVYAYLTVC